MLEDDVGILTDQVADVLAEASPFALVVGVLVLPELVLAGSTVDHRVDSHRVEDRALSGDDTTHTGIPPPLRTYCAAYAPIPPVAPQISTTSPCFIAAPFLDTSIL